MIDNLNSFDGVEFTINTTTDCNLRCTYCYEHKKPGSMSLDTARRYIDIILSDPDPCSIKGTQYEDMYKGIVLDFIGGDSLMNPALLHDILSYFQYKLWKTGNRARNNWRCSISTNGTLFQREDVRDFCLRWRDNLSLSVSIDGCPEIHDRYRVFADRRPSMPEILRGWGWYKSAFPLQAMSTKATCSKASIPYLYESLQWMHETLGLRYINQNFIMEDTGCTEDDYQELERQMEKCIRYVALHQDDLYWSMIDRERIAYPAESSSSFEACGHCGSGMMPTLTLDGRIYPCFRWLPIAQKGRDISSFVIGDTERGLWNKKALEAVRLGGIRANCTKDGKCLKCELEPICPYCIAGCYAEYGAFIRTNHICRIIQIQHKWAKRYWEEFYGKDKA